MSVFSVFVPAARKVGGYIIGWRRRSGPDGTFDDDGPIKDFYDLAMHALTLESVQTEEKLPDGTVKARDLTGAEKREALLPHARTYLTRYVFKGRKIGNKEAAETAAVFLVGLVVAVLDAFADDELEVKG